MYFETEPLVVVAQSEGAWAEEGSWLKSQAQTKFGSSSGSKGVTGTPSNHGRSTLEQGAKPPKAHMGPGDSFRSVPAFTSMQLKQVWLFLCWFLWCSL